MNIFSMLFINRYKFISLLLLLICAEALFLYNYYQKNYNIECESYIASVIPQQNIYLQATITLKFRNNGTGFLTQDGAMKKGEQSWRLNRDVTFTYKKINDTTIRVEGTHMTKSSTDNVPDILSALHPFSLEPDIHRTIMLHKIENSYLIGNQRAPAFICLPL